MMARPPEENPDSTNEEEQPDPEAEAAVRKADATPVCPHCFEPVEGFPYFCENCGQPLGQLTGIPFVHMNIPPAGYTASLRRDEQEEADSAAEADEAAYVEPSRTRIEELLEEDERRSTGVAKQLLWLIAILLFPVVILFAIPYMVWRARTGEEAFGGENLDGEAEPHTNEREEP